MKITKLLIEVVRKPTGQNDMREFSTVIENIHGISDDAEKLKKVALEENEDEPLNWIPTLSGNWEAKKSMDTKFEIIQVNNFN